VTADADELRPDDEPGPATTVEWLFGKYNTYTRRPALTNEVVRTAIFKSFARTIGLWLPSRRSANILDVGCGEGALLLFLRGAGYESLNAFDISPENVEICHGFGFAFVRQFDARQLRAFEPGVSYDAIFALDILEHLPKQAWVDFLRRIRERLRSGGSVVIQTPNMGCVLGHYHRFSDLSHEFCLTEKSALALMMAAGFDFTDIDIQPAWNATTFLGRLREQYLKLLHCLVFLAEDSSRPRIPTKNLLIRGTKS
jgi:2-polyprenyl-3-methyl-5-hydroxy-6-metoxy-1,4-benzoquinol methylase